MANSDAPVGGVKGFFIKAGNSFYSGSVFVRDASWWLAQKGGYFGLMIASTSMVVLLPLFFEINREAQVSVTPVPPNVGGAKVCETAIFDVVAIMCTRMKIYVAGDYAFLSNSCFLIYCFPISFHSCT